MVSDLRKRLVGSGRRHQSPPLALWTGCLFLANVGIGLALASLGPTLIELSTNLGVKLGTAASIFTFRAGGYLSSAVVSGKLFDECSNKALFFFAPLLFTTAGALVLPYVHSYYVACLCFFFQGASMGILDTAGNLLLLNLYRGSSYVNGAMHSFHFCFGLGAFCGPLLVSLELEADSLAISAWTTIGVLLLPSCFGFLALTCAAQPEDAEEELQPSSLNGTVVLCGMFLFIYVGTEVSFGGYIDAFAIQRLSWQPADAAKLTSLYWGFLCIGRLVAAAVTPRVHHAKYLAFHVSLAGLAATALICATTNSEVTAASSPRCFVGVMMSTAAFGFALAPLFPGAMLLTEELLGHTMSGLAATVLVVLAATGEMICPFLLGQLFDMDPRNFCWCIFALSLLSTLIFFKASWRLLAAPRT